MTVAGIDFSTKAVDIVLLDDDTDQAEWFRYEIADERGALWACRNLRLIFPGGSFFESRGVWLVGLEQPYSQSRDTAKKLGMVAGAIAARLPTDLTVIQTDPNEWHRIFTGNAKAGKEQIAERARGQRGYPDSEWPQDAYDALGIAYAVRWLNQHAIEGAA